MREGEKKTEGYIGREEGRGLGPADKSSTITEHSDRANPFLSVKALCPPPGRSTTAAFLCTDAASQLKVAINFSEQSQMLVRLVGEDIISG